MTPKQTAAQRRRAALVARLATIRHWLWGALAVAPVPGTVFDPRAFFLDPSRLPAVLAYWAARARRDGCGARLPRRERDAACEAAAQAALTYFLDADYRRLGVTADEFARAVLGAYRRARRAFWRDADAAREADRDRRAIARGRRCAGDTGIFNRAANSRTPDPARIVHAADAMGMDPNAVTGRGVCDESPGDAVTIPGGPAGRGETDGRMALVTIRDQAVNVTGPDGQRRELSILDQRWRMIRGRGRAQRLPACTVRAGAPAPRPVFRAGPVPGPMAADDPRRPREGDGVRTWRPMAAPPAVTVADAVHGMRRLGRSLPRGCDSRRRVAANLRAARRA